MRSRKPTKAEIEERLQKVSDGMANASFIGDEKGYYELFEERGELLQMLKQSKSIPEETAQKQG
jgi:hypothetical protein